MKQYQQQIKKYKTCNFRKIVMFNNILPYPAKRPEQVLKTNEFYLLKI